MTEIRTFSLNLGTSSKNFETTKRNENIKKEIFRNFPEKHCVLTLKICNLKIEYKCRRKLKKTDLVNINRDRSV